jgi:hypothetical protein
MPPITPPAIAPAWEWPEDVATIVEPAPWVDDDVDKAVRGVEAANWVTHAVLEPFKTKNGDEEV